MNDSSQQSEHETETGVTVRKTRVIGIYLLYISAVFFVVSMFSCMLGSVYGLVGVSPYPVPEEEAVDYGPYLLLLMIAVSFGSCLYFAYWGIYRIIHPYRIKRK